MLKTWSVLFLTLLLSLNLAPPALAQMSFGGDAPIDVKADRASYKGPKTVLTGAVDVRQGTSRFLANRMELFRKTMPAQENGKVKYGNINKIVATGKFRYITPNSRVTGEKGVYERDKNIITVIGNATFTQHNGNQVTGNRMIYDLTTNRAKIDGKCAGDDCQKKERVTINIDPGTGDK